MDYNYSFGGQFWPCRWPFYPQPVIVVQVPAYTCTSMRQQDYRPQTRNCIKTTSRTQKSNTQKRRDQQQREAFNSWKSVCASMPFNDLSNNDLAKVMPKHYPCKRDTDMIQVSNLDPKSSEINKLKSNLEQTQTTIVLLENTLAEERKSLLIAEEQLVQSMEQTSKLRAELSMATALKEIHKETIEELQNNNSSLKQQLDASLAMIYTGIRI